TKTPVKVGIVAMIVNLTLNLLLMGPLGHTGLALATSIAAFVNAGLLYLGLKRRDIYHSSTNWLSLGAKVLIASLLMCVTLVTVNRHFGDWYAAAIATRAGIIAALVFCGAGVYFSTLVLLGVRTVDVLPPKTPV
ncbi:MAG: lipid II flippase MurJ, partial [Gammaproteobacteria bacterium]